MTQRRVTRFSRAKFWLWMSAAAGLFLMISQVFAAWNQISQFGASDAASGARFGARIVRDGSSFLVAAPSDSGNKGAVYRFTSNGQGGYTQIKLTASDGAAGDLFGTSIAAYNGVIAVGAPGRNNNTGRAYIFTPDGQGGYTQTSIIGSDTGVFDLWGGSVAIGENLIAVGTFFDNSNRGAVYTFIPDGQGGWTQTNKIVPADSVAADYFGWTVAIANGKLIAAAVNDDENSISDRGSVYVFSPSGQNFAQTAKLLASDAAQDDTLGFALAVDGDTIVAGTPGDTNSNGKVYIFTPDGQGGYTETKLTANDGVANDQFGAAVDAYNGAIMVGAYQDDDAGADAGSAYIFSPSAPRAFDQVKLTALDGKVGDNFGAAVAIIAVDTLMVGAVYDDSIASDAGTVYFFSSTIIPTPTPTNTATLTATATFTPTNTPDIPTATPTPVYQELVLNGGMETDTNTDKIPDNWTLKNPLGDKRKCDTVEKQVAYTGECAFMFKGGAGEATKLLQNLDLTGVTFAVSDGLYLSGFFKATSTATKAKLKLKVTYGDGTAGGKLNLSIPQSADYTLLDDTLDLASANVTAIQVQIANASLSGKIFADDLSLLLVESAAINSNGVIKLP